MDIEQDVYAITTGSLKDRLERYIKIKQPVHLWGGPGVGKSYTAEHLADDLGMEYIDVRALTLDPVDLRGVPWRDENNRTRWASPSFLPPENATGQYLINFEELPAAPAMVQTALFGLVQERRLGEYQLPDGAALMACGNRVSDRGGSIRMPTPLVSKFVHIDVRADAREWTRWAAENALSPEVIFFMQYRPDLLSTFNPQTQGQGAGAAYACPRTWEFVSNVLNVDNASIINDRFRVALLRGIIGEAAAIEFNAFLDVMSELVHPKIVLANPDSATIPEDPAALLALCGSISRYVEPEMMESVAEYANRLTPEIGQFLINACALRNPENQATSAFIKWTALETL